MIPVPCTIGLGSNSEDREKQIENAIRHLETSLKNVKVSSIYESEALNGKDAPYLNAVVHGMTDLTAEAIVADLKAWEQHCGRDEEARRNHVVPIDLDLVIYNLRILRQADFDRHYFNRGYRELLAQGAFVND